jgi:CHAT domain-containing protein
VLSYTSGILALHSCARVASAGRVRRGLVVIDPQPSSADPIGFAASEAAWASVTDPTVVLTGRQANVATVLAAVTTADVVHLACHGTSYPHRPLESGLLLAGDERLTLADVLRTRLTGSSDQADADAGARLVILSACDTDQPGVALPDEVVSLPSALVQAGAAGVVASQWPVRSLAACLLTAAFHTFWQLDGADPPTALAAAQRWLRTTTNAEKVTDLTRWRTVFESNTQVGATGDRGRRGRHDVIRVLMLRDPQARDFTAVSAWGALGYHGV